jgi:hypothetical protein
MSLGASGLAPDRSSAGSLPRACRPACSERSRAVPSASASSVSSVVGSGAPAGTDRNHRRRRTACSLVCASAALPLEREPGPPSIPGMTLETKLPLDPASHAPVEYRRSVYSGAVAPQGCASVRDTRSYEAARCEHAEVNSQDPAPFTSPQYTRRGAEPQPATPAGPALTEPRPDGARGPAGVSASAKAGTGARNAVPKKLPGGEQAEVNSQDTAPFLTRTSRDRWRMP